MFAVAVGNGVVPHYGRFPELIQPHKCMVIPGFPRPDPPARRSIKGCFLSAGVLPLNEKTLMGFNPAISESQVDVGHPVA